MIKGSDIDGKALVERIEKRGAEFGFKSLSAICRAANVNYETVRNWRRDFKKKIIPKRESLLPVAQLLKTNQNWLLFGEGLPTQQEPSGIVAVPILSWVSAGELDGADTLPGDAEDYVSIADFDRGDFFALRVKGESMNRIISDRSIIIVDHASRGPIADEIFVIANPRTGEASVKRFRSKPPRFEADSHSIELPAIPASDVKIIGRVRMAIQKF